MVTLPLICVLPASAVFSLSKSLRALPVKLHSLRFYTLSIYIVLGKICMWCVYNYPVNCIICITFCCFFSLPKLIFLFWEVELNRVLKLPQTLLVFFWRYCNRLLLITSCMSGLCCESSQSVCCAWDVQHWRPGRGLVYLRPADSCSVDAWMTVKQSIGF